MTVAEALRFAGRPEPDRQGFFRCPSHDDAGRLNAHVVPKAPGAWKCFRCGAKGRVAELIVALGEAQDYAGAARWLESKLGEPPKKSAKKIIALYPYVDEFGALLYEVVRYDPKDFKQRRPDGRGGNLWNLDGVRRVAYGLPELLAGIVEGKTVWVAEGEGDVDSLRSRGLCATTSAQGANWTWTPEFAESFRGASRIVVIGDCDEAGRTGAMQRATTLARVSDDVRLLDLDPALCNGFDVTDFLEGGRTPEDLLALADSAPLIEAASEVGEVGLFGVDEGMASAVAEPTPVWDDAIPWPQLHHAALHGLAGEIVKALAPHTEADPAALLFTLLTMAGNMIGPGPKVRVGSKLHEPRLFLLLVGATAKSRKGQSLTDVLQVATEADPELVDAIRVTGLSTGEGLIKRLSDDDDAPAEKRAFVCEPEFARTLAVVSREHATLSAILRQAWDGDTLSVLTKNNPLKAHGAFVSFVGHITVEELHARLTDVQMANGFANRFLHVSVKRSRLLPDGGQLRRDEVERLGRKLRAALDLARTRGEMPRTEAFDNAYADLYTSAFPDESGLAGAIIARGETHTLRLALIYALLDGANELRIEHLIAGYAAWRYVDDSTRYVFGKKLGDDVRQRLLDEVRAVYPDGLDRTAQHNIFGRNASQARLKDARKWLIEHSFTHEIEDHAGAGRPRIVLYALPPSSSGSDLGAKALDRHISSNSFNSSVFDSGSKAPVPAEAVSSVTSSPLLTASHDRVSTAHEENEFNEESRVSTVGLNGAALQQPLLKRSAGKKTL